MATDAGPDAASRVARAYELALGRRPSADELRVGEEFLKTRTIGDFAHVVLNLNEFIYLR